MKSINFGKGLDLVVDDQDLDLLMANKWTLVKSNTGNSFYAARRRNKRTEFLHNLIMKREFGSIPKGKICDHINLNGLDNTRGNLRIATYSQNCANVPKKKKNPTSQYKGVFFRKE